MLPIVPTNNAFVSVTTSLALLTQAAARPNFELQFSIAQNAALDRLDRKIEEFQDSNFGRGQTALLRVDAARLERKLEEGSAYNATAETNRLTVKDLLDELTALRGFADPATVAEFETAQTQVLESLDRLLTAQPSRLGAPDGLSRAKSDGIAAISAVVTNNFASAADIQAAQDAIDALSADLTQSLSIIEINDTLSDTLIKSAQRSLADANAKIDEIENGERLRQLAEIEELREQTATVLTSLSLSFEGSQALTDALVKTTLLPREIEPGSVLNLFA